MIREKIVQGIVQLIHISNVNQLAYILTKPLAPPLFANFMHKLGNLNIHIPSWGDVRLYAQKNWTHDFMKTKELYILQHELYSGRIS